MTTSHHEILRIQETPSVYPELDSPENDTVPARRLGTTAVRFLSPDQRETPTKTLSRNGKSLARLHYEYTEPSHERESVPRGVLLEFELDKGYIGYNCSQAFEQTVENDGGELEERWYIAVRTEIEGTEGARVGFYFQRKDLPGGPPDAGVWQLDVSRQLPYDTIDFIEDETPYEPALTPLFIQPDFENVSSYTSPDVPNKPDSHQDPSVTEGKLNGKPLLAMTAVKARSFRPLASAPDEKRMPYHQEFFIGSSIDDLERIAVGPEGRKGTRIIYLGDNRWSVFNRPQSGQGAEFGPGVVTYAEFTATTREEFISGLQEAILDISIVIPDLCQDDEWVGPNFGWPLKAKNEDENNSDPSKRRIGMIGHIAAYIDRSTGEREYCATSYIYDPDSNTVEEVKIIVAKEAFEGLVGRRIDRDDLDRVIYPGGAVLLPNGKLRLYCGISDLEAGYVDIDDPFAGLRLETLN